MSDGMQWIVRFELPNGGAGPETVASGDLAAEYDAIAVLLLRDHYCQVSRDRASAYSDAVDAFADIELGADSLPAVGVLDTSSKFPRLVHAEGGDTIQDCPSPAEALDAVTDAIE